MNELLLLLIILLLCYVLLFISLELVLKSLSQINGLKLLFLNYYTERKTMYIQN